MSDLIPFFLREAAIALYPQNSSGEALTDQAIWTGALVNGLRIRRDFEELRIAPTGAAYKKTFHVDEEHLLELERVWFIRKTDLADYEPRRNQEYVLEIVWYDGAYWLKRTYYGVTAMGDELVSFGTNQFGNPQRLRAQRFVQAGGKGDPSVYTPINPATGDEQSVAFFRENLMVAGEYMLGHYRWPMQVKIKSAKVIAWAPQVTATVVELEVNGSLTGHQLTIPVGTANTEVSAELTLSNYYVTSGQSVRWKIVSGPVDSENMAWTASLIMQVEPS